MGNEKWDFDKEAASWDKNPGRVSLANDIAQAISDQKILMPDMDVLEFGCGTGLLTVQLSPLVRSVTGLDSSKGMLDVLKAKIKEHSLSNIAIKFLDPSKSELMGGPYHLVVCSMTLHHVKEIRPLINQFYEAAAPEGYVCIADLDPDGGEFHGDNDTVFHHGFDRATLRRILRDAGFDDIRETIAANVIKPISKGGVRSFSVFLMTGRKGKNISH
jgi:ubiquinone/menaquinone biosynthesis C-methylase UbiE